MDDKRTADCDADKRKLTRRQREVLDYLIRFFEENGYWPSRRDMAMHFGWSGPHAAVQFLRALKDKGWIEIPKRTNRAFRVVGRKAVLVVDDPDYSCRCA